MFLNRTPDAHNTHLFTPLWNIGIPHLLFEISHFLRQRIVDILPGLAGPHLGGQVKPNILVISGVDCPA